MSGKGGKLGVKYEKIQNKKSTTEVNKISLEVKRWPTEAGLEYIMLVCHNTSAQTCQLSLIQNETQAIALFNVRLQSDYKIYPVLKDTFPVIISVAWMQQALQLGTTATHAIFYEYPANPYILSCCDGDGQQSLGCCAHLEANASG